MKPQVRSIALRYGGAVLFVTAAILVTWTTPLRMRAPYLLLLTAAMLTSSIGGLLPGLVSALVVVGASLYFYVPWNTPLTYDSIPDLLGIVGFPLAAILIAGLTTAREQAEQAARTRARQQAAVANLGMQALAARDLTTLLDSAAGVVRETLGVDYCKVLKLLPGGRELLLIAGQGWKPGLVGHATEDTSVNSPGGFTLLQKEPVIVLDLSAEKRFHAPPLLVEHNVVTGMSVMIPGKDGPFGILGAYTTRRRVFTRDDIHFLQAAANVIGAAVERDRTEAASDESRIRLQSLFDNAMEPMLLADDDAHYIDINPAACELTGYSRSELLERNIWDLTPRPNLEMGRAAWQEFVSLGRRRGEYTLKRKDGTELQVEYQAVANIAPGVHLSVLHDVTERKREASRLAAQHAITRILAEASSLSEATPRVLESLCETTNSDFGVLWNVDREEGLLRCADIWRNPLLDVADFEGVTRESTFQRGVGLPGRVWETGQSRWTDDTTKEADLRRGPAAAACQLRSAFAFPISFGGQLTGVVELLSRNNREIDPALLEMLGAFGSQIGQFIERKRTEEALRLSREQQSVILQGVTDAITAQDPSGELVYANQAAAQLLGFESPEELMQTPVREVLGRFQLEDEEGRPFPVDRLPGRMALQGKSGQSMLLRYRVLKTGEERWALHRAAPVWDEQGQVRLAINIIHDVTEPKRAEERVRQQEELLRVTLSSIGDAVISTDARGRITFMNPAAGSATGWSPDQAIGRRIDEVLQVLNPDTRAAAEHPIYSVLEKRQSVDLKNAPARMGVTGRNVVIEGNAAPIRDKQEHVIGAALVFRDVTDRAQTEQAISRLAAIVRSSDDAIISKTVDGTILSWNPGAERLFGFTAQEAVGQSVAMIYPPERLEEFQEISRRLKRGEGIERLDTVRRRKDGSRVDVSISISVIKDAEGRPLAASTIARDISEQKRVEETQRFLAKASDVLSSSLDYETTLRSLAKLAVPEIADWCIVHVLKDDGTVQQLAVAHVDPTKIERVYELQQRYPQDPNARRGVPEVIRTGKPEIMPEITQEQIASAAHDPEHLERILELALKSYMIVPLIARGHTLGAISFVSAESGRRYGPADLALAQELARRAALSVDNARLYKEAQEVNQDLENRVIKRTVELEAANRKLKADAVERQKTNEQLRHLSAHLQSAREEERIRIAREIHDEIGQVMTAVKMDLSLLKNRIQEEKEHLNAASLVEDIDSTDRLLDDSIEITHRIIRELRPEILDHVGLQAAIEWQLQEFEARTKIECSLQSNLDEISLDRDRSTAVFRIFQEALTNVARHANATQVEACLFERDGNLILEIRDNGRGIAPEELNSPRSFGLLGMQERANEFGGAVTFSPAATGGTIVSVQIPREREATRADIGSEQLREPGLSR